VTNALKHAGMTPEMKTRLSVSFRQGEPGHAVLEISSTGAGDASARHDEMLESTGIGQQLLSAFASQLRGNLTLGDEGELYVLRLTFPVENLSASEHRNVTEQG
jgi:two-component sensor histidine kinase